MNGSGPPRCVAWTTPTCTYARAHGWSTCGRGGRAWEHGLAMLISFFFQKSIIVLKKLIFFDYWICWSLTANGELCVTYYCRPHSHYVAPDGEMCGVRMGPLTPLADFDPQNISHALMECMDGLQVFVEEKLRTLILILHGYWVIFITSIFIFVTQNSMSTHRCGFWKNNPLSIISHSEAWI